MAKTINLAQTVPGYKSGAKEFIVKNRDTGKVKVLTREQLRLRNPGSNDSVIPKPFQGKIIDGGGEIAEVYLQKEFPLMLQFFKEHGIEDPEATYDFDKTGEYWLTVDFPLPEYARMPDGTQYRFPSRSEPFLFILNSYPDTPPIGFHVSKDSPNIQALETIFATHIYHRALLENEHVGDSLENGWHWICFHYQDQSWQFNRNDIEEGDNLSYFMHYIYHKICGVEGVSDE